jgi:hypothetical protein
MDSKSRLIYAKMITLLVPLCNYCKAFKSNRRGRGVCVLPRVYAARLLHRFLKPTSANGRAALFGIGGQTHLLTRYDAVLPDEGLTSGSGLLNSGIKYRGNFTETIYRFNMYTSIHEMTSPGTLHCLSSILTFRQLIHSSGNICSLCYESWHTRSYNKHSSEGRVKALNDKHCG